MIGCMIDSAIADAVMVTAKQLLIIHCVGTYHMSDTFGGH